MASFCIRNIVQFKRSPGCLFLALFSYFYQEFNNMDILIKSPGLHHIIEKSLLFLDKESISSFRLLNQDCNKIVDRPSFYLKKFALLEDDLLTESITDWQKLAENINDEDIEKKISLELFKQFCRGFYKDPLELVFEEGNFNDNLELVAFILENSDPNSFLPLHMAIAKIEKKVVHFIPMHLVGYFNFFTLLEI